MYVSSRAAAARTPSTAPYPPIEERKANPWIHFIVVLMASGIARGRLRTTTILLQTG